MQPSSSLGIHRALTALARAPRWHSMLREKLWLHSSIAVRSRSSGPPVRRSRATWFCITSRGRSARDAEIWISVTEHPCVLSGARHYFPGRHRLIPARRSGIVDLDWLEANLRASRPGAVAVMAANNETGVLQPWREILSLCRQREVPLFCDGAQWMGKEAAHGLGACEYLSGCAHKFGGPRGVGFLKVPRRGRFYPLVLGGGQEAGRRAGTENVAGVLSMIVALEHRERSLAGHPIVGKDPAARRVRDKAWRDCSGHGDRRTRRRSALEYCFGPHAADRASPAMGGEARQARLCRLHGFCLCERHRRTFARSGGNGVCAG